MIGDVDNRQTHISKVATLLMSSGKKIAVGSVALIVLAALICAVIPPCRQFAIHLITHQMTVKHVLLYVGVPLAGITVAFYVALAIFKKHKKRTEYDFELENDAAEALHKRLFHTIKGLNYRSYSAQMGVAAIASLAIITAVVCFILKCHIGSAHTGFEHLLNYKIADWEGLALGLGLSAALFAGIHAIFYISKKIFDQKQVVKSRPHTKDCDL